MRISIAFAVIGALPGCSAPGVSSPELDAFRFEGKPIHPALIDELIPWLSDPEPTINALDLVGFARSNRVCGWTVIEEDGWIKGTREDQSHLNYRFLGVGEKGSAYLDVLDWGGGSASWRYLVQVRFEAVEAFDSRRLLLRVENVTSLGCCPFGKVEAGLFPGPCERHPRPIPDVEPADVEKSSPSLTVQEVLGTWDSYVVRENRTLGRIHVFPHSIFVERQGSVPFALIAAVDGKCLLHLATEVDSSRYLLLDARSSLAPAPATLRVSFHETLEKGRDAFATESRAGSNWSRAD